MLTSRQITWCYMFYYDIILHFTKFYLSYARHRCKKEENLTENITRSLFVNILIYSKTWLLRTPTGLSKSVRFSKISGLMSFIAFSCIFERSSVYMYVVDLLTFMWKIAEDKCFNMYFIFQPFNTWKRKLNVFMLYFSHYKSVYLLFVEKN